MDDWTAIYKFARLALLAGALVGIALYLYWPGSKRKARLEEPAHRMLQEDDE